MCLHLKMRTNIKPYLASLLINSYVCQVGFNKNYFYAFLDAGTCICSDTYRVSLVI